MDIFKVTKEKKGTLFKVWYRAGDRFSRAAGYQLIGITKDYDEIGIIISDYHTSKQR